MAGDKEDTDEKTVSTDNTRTNEDFIRYIFLVNKKYRNNYQEAGGFGEEAVVDCKNKTGFEKGNNKERSLGFY